MKTFCLICAHMGMECDFCQERTIANNKAHRGMTTLEDRTQFIRAGWFSVAGYW